jgi:cytochrome c-type biogenesis protein CcmH
MIDSGMTEDQILDAFVAKYGQTVLAAPPANGFNLAAWIVPFAGFLFGASALAIYLKRQQKNDNDGPPDNSKPSRQADKDEFDEYYREQLKQELEQRK